MTHDHRLSLERIAALLEHGEQFRGKLVGTVLTGGNLTAGQVRQWLALRCSSSRLSLQLPAACSSIRGMDLPVTNEPLGQRSDTSVQMQPAVRAAAQSIRAASVGAVALGALAFGAAAIGALAIGRVVIGVLALKRGHVRSLAVEDLQVGRLHVRELAIDRETAGRPRA